MWMLMSNIDQQGHVKERNLLGAELVCCVDCGLKLTVPRQRVVMNMNALFVYTCLVWLSAPIKAHLAGVNLFVSGTFLVQLKQLLLTWHSAPCRYACGMIPRYLIKCACATCLLFTRTRTFSNSGKHHWTKWAAIEMYRLLWIIKSRQTSLTA